MLATEDIRIFEELSERARIFLSHDESYDVEFKLKADGLSSDDLVAFANSQTGGTILIGIKDSVSADGLQMGEIVGCKVGDDEKLKFIGIAKSCHPPIDIEIFIENSKYKPFYRIVIQTGKSKPYCTSKGTYVIRGDGRNIPLTPVELLGIFLEENSSDFITKFTQATKELDSNLQAVSQEVSVLNKEIKAINGKLKEEIDTVLQNVERLGDGVDMQLSEIFSAAQNAESLSDEAMGHSDEAAGGIRQVDEKIDVIDEFIYAINEKVNLLLDYFKLEDPKISRIRTLVKELSKPLYDSGKSEEEIFEDINTGFYVSNDFLRAIIRDTIKEIEASKLL